MAIFPKGIMRGIQVVPAQPIAAEDVEDLADEVLVIEQTLDANPSGIYGSIAEALDRTDVRSGVIAAATYTPAQWASGIAITLDPRMAAPPAVAVMLNEQDVAPNRPILFTIDQITPLGFRIVARARDGNNPGLSGRVGWIAISIVPFPA